MRPDTRRGYRYRRQLCAVCGTEYQPKGSRQRTCSRHCGQILAQEVRRRPGPNAIPNHPDRGCELAPRCLTCPLPCCKYDREASRVRTEKAS